MAPECDRNGHSPLLLCSVADCRQNHCQVLRSSALCCSGVMAEPVVGDGGCPGGDWGWVVCSGPWLTHPPTCIRIFHEWKNEVYQRRFKADCRGMHVLLALDPSPPASVQCVYMLTQMFRNVGVNVQY